MASTRSPMSLYPTVRMSSRAQNRSPTHTSGSPGDVLVLHRDRDVAFKTAFLDHRLEVVKLVSIADDSGARGPQSQPLLEN